MAVRAEINAYLTYDRHDISLWLDRLHDYFPGEYTLIIHAFHNLDNISSQQDYVRILKHHLVIAITTVTSKTMHSTTDLISLLIMCGLYLDQTLVSLLDDDYNLTLYLKLSGVDLRSIDLSQLMNKHLYTTVLYILQTATVPETTLLQVIMTPCPPETSDMFNHYIMLMKHINNLVHIISTEALNAPDRHFGSIFGRIIETCPLVGRSLIRPGVNVLVRDRYGNSILQIVVQRLLKFASPHLNMAFIRVFTSLVEAEPKLVSLTDTCGKDIFDHVKVVMTTHAETLWVRCIAKYLGGFQT